MGILFLIIFTLAEITLAVLSCTKFSEKVKWMQNRLIVRGVESALILLIILLPVTYMKWRFILAAAIVFIRLIIAGIIWLIKRRKAEGVKKKAGVIIGCILSVVLIAVSLTPAFLFTNYHGLETTGEYKVKETGVILTDESREDEFEKDGSFREIPAHFYYPEDAEGNFPLIIFSHGAFGYYQSNYSTYAELVSNGYIVVALDHPHHAFFTKDTAGQIVTVDPDFINSAMTVGDGTGVSDEEIFNITQSWMKLRTDDESFVLDSIKVAKDKSALSDSWQAEDEELILHILSVTDTDRIGLMGHSLGGASGIALGRKRDDIGAVIDLDGTALGELSAIVNGKGVYKTEAYPVPVLVFSQGKDYNEEEQSGAYAGINERLVENAKDGKIVYINGAGHMDFTDLPIFSPFLGSMFGSGKVDSRECMTTVNAVSLNWFNYYLKNEGALDIKASY